MQTDSGISQLEPFWFPGRWLGGSALVLAPILLLAGELLRAQYHFFFPDQLKAFEQHPELIATSYNMFLAGNILLWPAILTIVHFVAQTRPNWGLWGGTFVIFGLFARTFHYGANHLAFQMVNALDLKSATDAVANSYGAFHIVSVLSATLLFGWIILATGCYLSGTMGIVRSICLATMSALMIGVLKGTSITSIISITGLCIALVPQGFQVLLKGPLPPKRTIAGWLIFIVALVAAFYFLGQAG